MLFSWFERECAVYPTGGSKGFGVDLIPGFSNLYLIFLHTNAGRTTRTRTYDNSNRQRCVSRDVMQFLYKIKYITTKNNSIRRMDATWFSSPGEGTRQQSHQVVADPNHHQNTPPLDTVLLTGSDWNALLQGVVNMCVSFDGNQQGDDDVYYLVVTTRSMMHHMSSLTGASVVNRIQIKYVETLYDVIKLGSVLHLVMRQGSERPCVVILHGLDTLVDASHGISSSLASVSSGGGRNKQGRHVVESLLCRALAVVVDAVENTRKTKRAIVCATLWSENVDTPPRYFFFVSRWLKCMYGMYKSDEPGREWYHTVSKIEFDGLTHGPVRVGPRAYVQGQRINA